MDIWRGATGIHRIWIIVVANLGEIEKMRAGKEAQSFAAFGSSPRISNNLTMANPFTLAGKIPKRRGPKPADLSYMAGRTYGSLKVTGIAQGRKQRHQIVDATCLVCGRKTQPRARDVLVGKTKTCSCGQKKQYKEHKETIALAYTTPAQRRAIFRYRIGKRFRFPFRFRLFKGEGRETKGYRVAKDAAQRKWAYRSSFSARDDRTAATFGIPRDLIGPIVRLERKRLVDLYPSSNEMNDARKAGLISEKELRFCIAWTPREPIEPIVITLEELLEEFLNGRNLPQEFLAFLAPGAAEPPPA